MADTGIGKGVDATKSFVKNHWIAFIVVAFVVVAAALAYDHKNQGKLSNMIAGLPLVGRLFA